MYGHSADVRGRDAGGSGDGWFYVMLAQILHIAVDGMRLSGARFSGQKNIRSGF